MATKEQFINDEIVASEVLLIDENGVSLGVVSKDDALKIASSKDLDLVMMSATGKNPVCKIMDYNKFKYNQQKKQKEMKKNQKTVDTKEIRLSYRIDKHDFDTKVKNARKFLLSGNNVNITLRLRGRENVFADMAEDVINNFFDACSDVGNKIKHTKNENNFIIVMEPKKN